MIAVDTNILVRFFVRDQKDDIDLKQHKMAAELIEASDHLFVPITVLLELEWVLRGAYKYKASQVFEVMTNLIGWDNVTIEKYSDVQRALQYYKMGLDFADALHLAAAENCKSFATFDDKNFARRANRLNLKPTCITPA